MLKKTYSIDGKEFAKHYGLSRVNSEKYWVVRVPKEDITPTPQIVFSDRKYGSVEKSYEAAIAYIKENRPLKLPNSKKKRAKIGQNKTSDLPVGVYYVKRDGIIVAIAGGAQKKPYKTERIFNEMEQWAMEDYGKAKKRVMDREEEEDRRRLYMSAGKPQGLIN